MNIDEQVTLLMQSTEYGDDQLKQAMADELRERLIEAKKEADESIINKVTKLLLESPNSSSRLCSAWLLGEIDKEGISLEALKHAAKVDEDRWVRENSRYAISEIESRLRQKNR